ncbi:Mitochondrial acidic protein MAM33 [Morus notabilis]|uniref:Mitochondrial acidic protein MAM33 n=1 Tax=Morus notabilis TaxID=981085 RepID=W9QV24_9ROSA|nr:uncharacterized protein LOC21399584 [Morus notabilis]EXB39071.1 Mitochondrial acidic protein MAM33 [Morus notabilis]
MRKLSTILRKGQKALQDLELLKILQSEISHELSSNPFQDIEGGSLGDFVVDWDSAKSRDVVLRRKCDTGEEVVVSALLGPLPVGSGTEVALPRDVLMKVCVKKPGLRSLLQFDCEFYQTDDDDGSAFDIHNAHYLQSSTIVSNSAYRGPLFSSLDLHLQTALKDYLVAKGVGGSLINFLRLHLHKKEQDQYVNWLKKLESLVAKAE